MVNRWCPSCRKPWPAERVVCPDCLVELVDDLGATVRCRHCGRDWPASMQSCPDCLSELRLDPEAALEAMGDILDAGGHLYRPAGVPAFAEGPACILRRLSARGSLAYIGPAERVEALVSGPGGRALPPLTCRDHDDSVLFTLVAYAPVESALVALEADGAPLATYIRAGTGMDVRDETSAPVAALRRARGDFELVETGGAVLARVGSIEAELDDTVDDQWWLEPASDVRRLPLRPLASVALLLAAKVLFGWPWPQPVGSWAEVLTDDDDPPWPFRL